MGAAPLLAFQRQAAEHKRANAERVAERVERMLVDERHGISAAHELHRLANAFAQMARPLGEIPDKARRDLGIGARHKRDAQIDELAAQLVGIHERAVMRQRNDHVVDRREMRLRGLPAFGARCAVAHVSDGEVARERAEVCVRKHLVEEAQVLTDHHRAAVAHSDARRFLAAMLQRLEAKVCEARDVEAGRPNAEDTALLMERIILAGAWQRHVARG